VLTLFSVSDDVERSRRFYTEVLGGETLRGGEPSNVALDNNWIIINLGGGPTDDKPSVILETPRDLERVSSVFKAGYRHPRAVRGLDARGRPVPDATEPARKRDSLLPPRSRRTPDRRRPNTRAPA
jgi:hypothetical protein